MSGQRLAQEGPGEAGERAEEEQEEDVEEDIIRPSACSALLRVGVV